MSPGSARRSTRVQEKVLQAELGDAFESKREFPNGLEDDDEDSEREDGKQRRGACPLVAPRVGRGG